MPFSYLLFIIFNISCSTDFFQPETKESFFIKGPVESIDIKYFNESIRDSSFYKKEKLKFDNDGKCAYKEYYHYFGELASFSEEIKYNRNAKVLSKYQYDEQKELFRVVKNYYKKDILIKTYILNDDTSKVNKSIFYEYTKNVIVKKEKWGRVNSLSEFDNTKPNIDSIICKKDSFLIKKYYWSLSKGAYIPSSTIKYDSKKRTIEKLVNNRTDVKSVSFYITDPKTGKKILNHCDNWFSYQRNEKGVITSQTQYDEQTTFPCTDTAYKLNKNDDPISEISTDLTGEQKEIFYKYQYDKHMNWTIRKKISNGILIERVLREVTYYE